VPITLMIFLYLYNHAHFNWHPPKYNLNNFLYSIWPVFNAISSRSPHLLTLRWVCVVYFMTFKQLFFNTSNRCWNIIWFNQPVGRAHTLVEVAKTSLGQIAIGAAGGGCILLVSQCLGPPNSVTPLLFSQTPRS